MYLPMAEGYDVGKRPVWAGGGGGRSAEVALADRDSSVVRDRTAPVDSRPPAPTTDDSIPYKAEVCVDPGGGMTGGIPAGMPGGG